MGTFGKSDVKTQVYHHLGSPVTTDLYSEAGVGYHSKQAVGNWSIYAHGQYMQLDGSTCLYVRHAICPSDGRLLLLALKEALNIATIVKRQNSGISHGPVCLSAGFD
jgi:hypothetical protein